MTLLDRLRNMIGRFGIAKQTLHMEWDKGQNSANTGRSRVSSSSDVEPHLIHGTIHFMNELFLQLR